MHEKSLAGAVKPVEKTFNTWQSEKFDDGLAERERVAAACIVDDMGPQDPQNILSPNVS